MGRVQVIKTDGDDLVVLSRRAYDSLLARAGDPAAEDVMTAHVLAERRAQTPLPAEVLDRILDGGNALAVVAEHRRLSQAELARRTGLSQPFISKLMRGEVGGSHETMQRLCTALAVSEDVLAG